MSSSLFVSRAIEIAGGSVGGKALTTRPKRKAPPAPRPKRRRKTKAAPVEPVLSEYELGRRAKIKRNNKFLVSVGLLFPPQEALEDDEHPWWYMTAR